MRPTYETISDRSNELSVMGVLSKSWKREYHKLPIKDNLDYAIYKSDGFISGFVEVKSRKVQKEKYPTYIISMSKILKAKSIFDTFGLPTYLVVQWTDTTGWWLIDSLKDTYLTMGGRKDRGDGQDIEPVLNIPISVFRDIDDLPENIAPRVKRIPVKR